MKKQVSFGDKDAKLVTKITEFQKSQGLSCFIDAVRVLCENGLAMSSMVKKLK